MTPGWRTQGRRVLAPCLVLAFVLAACSSDTASTAVPAPESTGSTSTAAAEPSSTTEPGLDLDDLEQTWAMAWAAAGQPREVRADALAAFGDDIGPQAVEALSDVVRGGEQTFDNYPVFTENADGSITINDCLISSVLRDGNAASWYEGQAVPIDNGWRIETVTPVALDGCVPAVLADEIIADYLKAVEAPSEYWNPAQPFHPLVTETMTGARLERIQAILIDHERDGWYLIDEIESRPEVFAVLTATQVKVADCQTSAPGRGLFDAEGNVQEGLPDIERPDQRNLEEVTMRLVDGSWKAADVQGQDDWDCDFAPSDRGLPKV